MTTNVEHFPWHYTAFGIICVCGEAMRADETCPERDYSLSERTS